MLQLTVPYGSIHAKGCAAPPLIRGIDCYQAVGQALIQLATAGAYIPDQAIAELQSGLPVRPSVSYGSGHRLDLDEEARADRRH